MHENGNMRPVETPPSIGGRGVNKMIEMVNLSMIDLVYCKNFCKYHNVPPV
jgi:hypothetical protein